MPGISASAIPNTICRSRLRDLERPSADGNVARQAHEEAARHHLRLRFDYASSLRVAGTSPPWTTCWGPLRRRLGARLSGSMGENFKVREDLHAVGPWNKDSPADEANREYFSDFVDVVVKALTHDTFSHRGRY